MYYYMQTPYSTNYEYLMDAIKRGGNDVEYIVMDPLAKITVYQYQKQLLDKATALANFELLESIAAANTESEYAEYYQQAWGAAKAHYAPVETEIFDCEYFKESYKAEYAAAPDDMDNVRLRCSSLRRLSSSVNSRNTMMQELLLEKLARQNLDTEDLICS